MFAMVGMVDMVGIVDGEIGGSGCPGGGIDSPARAAYGPTCVAIGAVVGCCAAANEGCVVAGVAGGGVLP
jgi:hypothetical protein